MATELAQSQTFRIRGATASDAKAVLDLLMSEQNLEIAFDHHEFQVAETGGHITACGRLRPLGEGNFEIASVVVEKNQRGTGQGRAIVERLLSGVDAPVFALALAPKFFERAGFQAITKSDLPPYLLAKADGICKTADFVPMLRGRAS